VKLHVLGASGSGTTTLGAGLARALDLPHADSDDHFWLPTDPPYQTRRPREDRLVRLRAALHGDGSASGWVVSGHLIGWGDVLTPEFDAVVYLDVPTDTRLQRLQAREAARFGPAIQPGGPRRAQHLAFLTWAARYDDPAVSRSRPQHAAWLAQLPCPVVRLKNTAAPAALLTTALQALTALRPPTAHGP
jgi:adenylate kinase family enzyme